MARTNKDQKKAKKEPLFTKREKAEIGLKIGSAIFGAALGIGTGFAVNALTENYKNKHKQ